MIKSGAAKQKLEEFVAFTQKLKAVNVLDRILEVKRAEIAAAKQRVPRPAEALAAPVARTSLLHCATSGRR